jgi:hypothetical protein
MLGRIEEQVKCRWQIVLPLSRDLRANPSGASPLDVRKAYGFP